MIKVHDFRCTRSTEVFERFVVDTPNRIECNCGEVAERMISPIRCQLDPYSGHFPGATMKWAKAHEDGAKAGK